MSWQQWYCPNCGRPAEDTVEFDPDPPLYRSCTTVLLECQCGAIIEDGYFIGKDEMLDKLRNRP